MKNNVEGAVFIIPQVKSTIICNGIIPPNSIISIVLHILANRLRQPMMDHYEFSSHQSMAVPASKSLYNLTDMRSIVIYRTE